MPTMVICTHTHTHDNNAVQQDSFPRVRGETNVIYIIYDSRGPYHISVSLGTNLINLNIGQRSRHVTLPSLSTRHLHSQERLRIYTLFFISL
jgi:hypothetical protein